MHELSTQIITVPRTKRVSPETKLRFWAEGYGPYEAAAEYLLKCSASGRIRSSVWVIEPDLVSIGGEDAVERARRSATLSLRDKAHANIVFQLAGQATTEPIGFSLPLIDDRDVALLLNCLARAARWNAKNIAASITGTFDERSAS